MNLDPVDDAFARCRHLYAFEPGIAQRLRAAADALNAVDATATPSARSTELLLLCAAAIRELQRLHEAGELSAMRAVSYAMHVVPSVIEPAERFNSELFEFNVRVAASQWSRLSRPFKEALAGAARLDIEDVEQRCQQGRFAVDIEPRRARSDQ